MAWVAPRRTKALSGMFRAMVTGTYLLNSVMGRVKMPVDEFSQNHLVAFEVPPLTLSGFENDFLKLG